VNKNKRRLKLYEEYIRDLSGLEISPFEFIDTLYVRDRLFEDYNDLNDREKEVLRQCDKIFLDNVKKFYEHINFVYDFSNNESPLSRWWWHLDKLINGRLKVDLSNYKIIYKDEYYIEKSYSLSKDINTTSEMDSYVVAEKFSTDVTDDIDSQSNKTSNFNSYVRVA